MLIKAARQKKKNAVNHTAASCKFMKFMREFLSFRDDIRLFKHFLIRILNFFSGRRGRERGGWCLWHCWRLYKRKKNCLQYGKEEDKKAGNYRVQEWVYIQRQGEKLECPAVRTTINIDHVKLWEGKKAVLYFKSESLRRYNFFDSWMFNPGESP